MKSNLALTAIALFAFPALAIAQTSSAPSTAAPKASTPSQSGSMSSTMMPANGGLRMADTATLAVKFVTVKPADLMSSRLVGLKVYNNQNESLGEIEDLVIDNGKTITGVVVSVGGFLGMGESYVVVDPATIVLNQQNNNWRAFVDTNKDTLKNAPKFQYSKKMP